MSSTTTTTITTKTTLKPIKITTSAAGRPAIVPSASSSSIIASYGSKASSPLQKRPSLATSRLAASRYTQQHSSSSTASSSSSYEEYDDDDDYPNPLLNHSFALTIINAYTTTAAPSVRTVCSHSIVGRRRMESRETCGECSKGAGVVAWRLECGVCGLGSCTECRQHWVERSFASIDGVVKGGEVGNGPGMESWGL